MLVWIRIKKVWLSRAESLPSVFSTSGKLEKQHGEKIRRRSFFFFLSFFFLVAMSARNERRMQRHKPQLGPRSQLGAGSGPCRRAPHSVVVVFDRQRTIFFIWPSFAKQVVSSCVSRSVPLAKPFLLHTNESMLAEVSQICSNYYYETIISELLISVDVLAWWISEVELVTYIPLFFKQNGSRL